MSKTSQVLLASLLLVLAILVAEQSLYLVYMFLCWSANLLAGVRTVAFSLPEVISSPAVSQSHSLQMEQFTSRVEAELGRMRTEIDLFKNREENVENDEKMKSEEWSGDDVRDDDNSRRELEKLKMMFQEYQDSESVRNKDVNKLRGTFESLARRLEELESEHGSTNTNTTLTLENTLNDVRQELLHWKKRTENDSGFVQKQLKDVLDKYAQIPNLEESIRDLNDRTSKLKLDMNRREQLTEPETERERVDWASSELGSSISPGTDTAPYLGAPETELTVFGVSVWRKFSPLSSVTRRPHSGHCWAFTGHSGSLVLNTSRPVSLDAILMEHPNSPAAPRHVTVTDLSRW